MDQVQYDKVMRYIDIGRDEGANCVAGGNRFGETGFFIEPTVFSDVSSQCSAASAQSSS